MTKPLMDHAKKALLILSAGFILLWMGGASINAFAKSLSVDPTPTPETTQTPLPDALAQNSPHASGDCLDCHGDPALTGKTLDGNTISLYIELAVHENSFHSRESGGCNKFCHQDQATYPHKTSTASACATCHWQISGESPVDGKLVFDLPYEDTRSIALEVNAICQKCHVEIFESTTDSAHTQIMQEGNRFAPVCSDCHSAHDISQVSHQGISDICKKCHLAEYLTYKGSVHGAALEADSNQDVPTCANCHGSHKISGPDNSDFRTASIKICGDCHSDPTLMDKYNISTDVLSTYMDDVHGLTDFYRKTNLESITRTTCFDCHGKHNILSPDNPSSKVYPDNLQNTCQDCHGDTNIRFPESWLSHQKIDSVENTGLNLVNRISSFVVISVIAVILVLIILDVRRRVAYKIKFG